MTKTPGTDGTDGRTDAKCPADIGSINEAGRILAAEMKRGNVLRGQVRRCPGGQADVVFRLRDGSACPDEDTKAQRAAAWMRGSRELGRVEFFKLCPFAGQSASLHHQALGVLSRAGQIVKDHGVWVWRE